MGNDRERFAAGILGGRMGKVEQEREEDEGSPWTGWAVGTVVPDEHRPVQHDAFAAGDEALWRHVAVAAVEGRSRLAAVGARHRRSRLDAVAVGDETLSRIVLDVPEDAAGDPTIETYVDLEIGGDTQVDIERAHEDRLGTHDELDDLADALVARAAKDNAALDRLVEQATTPGGCERDDLGDTVEGADTTSPTAGSATRGAGSAHELSALDGSETTSPLARSVTLGAGIAHDLGALDADDDDFDDLDDEDDLDDADDLADDLDDAVFDDDGAIDAAPVAAAPAVSRKVRPRHRRRDRPRSKTIALKRLTREELRRGALENPPIEGVERPHTRAECRDAPRPCPWVACKHHLYLDINPRTGSIKINFPDLEPWELQHTCALDVADGGGLTLEEIGVITNLTRERVRQVEVRGLLTLKARSRSLR